MLYSPRDSVVTESHCKTILFLYHIPVPAINHITLSDKTIWSGDTVSAFSLPIPTTSRGLKESGLFLKKWSLASQRGYVPSLHPQLTSDSSYLK